MPVLLNTALAVLHPLFFAAAFVLDRYALTNTSIDELVRGLLVVVIVAGAILLVALGIMQHLAWAPIVASIVFLTVAFHPIPAAVLVAITIWWMLVGWLRRRRGARVEPLGVDGLPVRLAVVYSLVLLAVGAWSAVTATPGGPEGPITLAQPTESGGPDIYVLMLDGYPRGDTLRDEFGFNNSAFESRLEALDFQVADGALANYNKTWLSMPALLSAQYVHDLPEVADPPAGAPAQARLAHRLINGSAVPEYLRQRGYRIVSIPSSVMSTDVTSDAEVRTTRHLTSFEIALASAWLPAWIAPQAVLGMLAEDVRGNASTQLALLAEYAEPGEVPRLVIGHLMAPHPPFVLGQKPDYLRECFPACKVWETTVEETGMTEDAYAARMSIQVSELNEMVIAVVERIVTANPAAVVIVLSDHGARHDLDHLDEHFEILFAARTPRHDDLFPDDVSMVNVFRRVLSAYFGESLPDLPYEAWVSDWMVPLAIERYR